MTEYQIDYTSRDFESIKADLIKVINYRTNNQWDLTDPSDLGSILIEAFAYMGDMMSYYIDRVANESSVMTATKEENLLNFANLYGYKPSGPTPATVEVTFTNNGITNIDIPVGTQVIGKISYNSYTEIYFETLNSAIGLLPGQSVTLTCQEGKTVNTDRPDLIDPTTNKALPISLGISSGAAGQELSLIDLNVVDTSLKVYVGQGSAFVGWTYVDSLLDHGPGETVFTTRRNSDGTVVVLFGDSVNGAIPQANALISAVYKVSAGYVGNIASNIIAEVTYIPGNTESEAVTYLAVNNSAASFGGADADSIDQLRTKIKAAIATKRRAVTLIDYEYLASLVPQVGKVKAASAVYSSVQIYLQPQNDGSTTPGIVLSATTTAWEDVATNIASFLSDKVPAGTTVSVLAPTYKPLVLDIDITVDDAYKQATVYQDVYRALIGSEGLFSYDMNTFGRTITRSSIISKVTSVPGVTDITINDFDIDIPFYSPNNVILNTGEIGYLTPANLTVTPTGGLA